MKIAVVGNGPSAEVHKAAWSQAYRVVRCNIYAPGRCDFWASHFDGAVLAGAKKAGQCIVEEPVGAPSVFWLAISPAADRAIRPDVDLRANAEKLAAGRPIRQIGDGDWIELGGEIGEKRPTTGLVALRMALDLLPREIILAGFDATTPDAPGWGDAYAPWAESLPYHDFAEEKRAIQRLVDTGKFCGYCWPSKITWLKMQGVAS